VTGFTKNGPYRTKQKIKLLWPLGRVNPPLCYVQILKDKISNAWRDRRLNRTWYNKVNEVKYCGNVD